MSVPIKRITQKSGFKVLLAGLIGIVAGYLPQIIEVIEFPKPWDGLVPIFIGMVVAILKLIQEQLTNPSVRAVDVPLRAGMTVTKPDGKPIRFTPEGKVVK